MKTTCECGTDLTQDEALTISENNDYTAQIENGKIIGRLDPLAVKEREISCTACGAALELDDDEYEGDLLEWRE